MSRMLCVWLPQWPLQRWLRHARLGPADASIATALFEDGRYGRRLVHCCPLAVKAGLQPGQPVAEAQAIVGTDPVRFAPVDRAADLTALLGLAGWCQQFAPRVGLNEAEFPEALLLDVSGCGTYFGSEAVLIADVQRAFAAVGYAVSLAIADTIGAAWAVSRFSPPSQIVPSQEPLQTVLAPLPVAALRLDEETVRTLRELGVEQIGQLQSLPRSGLPARLGRQVLERLDQALGLRPEILRPHRPLPPIEARRELEEPVEQRLAVEHLGKALLAEVLPAVEARGQGVIRLTFQFQMEARRQLLTVGVSRPTLDRKHLHNLLRLQLERQAPAQPITALRLRVRETAPLAISQGAWWVGDDSAEKRGREGAALVDRLSSRLGSEAVLRAGLTGEVQPELAIRYEPWIPSPGSSPSKSSRRRVARPDKGVGSAVPRPTTPLSGRATPSGNTSHVTISSPRPLRLLAPFPIHATSVVPDGPPLRFWWRTVEHVVARWWGPERLETGWWRHEPAARDYYRVETREGLHAWLFRNRMGDGWYLQGWFD